MAKLESQPGSTCSEKVFDQTIQTQGCALSRLSRPYIAPQDFVEGSRFTLLYATQFGLVTTGFGNKVKMLISKNDRPQF